MQERACSGRRSDDEFEGSAFFQTARVIVQVHREQARSYGGYWIGVPLLISMHRHSEAPNERDKSDLVTFVWAGIPAFRK
jgi:hypothetical protein